MRIPLLLLLIGCSKPFADLPQLSFEEIPYDNPMMEATDAVITAFDTQLTCPDGTDARLFALYRNDVTEMSPVAIVLHSGAFDYTDIDGVGYHNESRLQRSWAITKVWETLGLSTTAVDLFEDHQGALSAALTDAGFIQLYPGNCWGDLWHNEQGYQDNDTSLEGFSRNGRTFAYWMLRLITDPSFAESQNFQLPVTWDSESISLIGLGNGGRGVAEMLNHDSAPAIQGIIVDSSPDLLTPYLDDADAFPDEVEGLQRIFGEKGLDAIDDWSLHTLNESGGLPEKVGFIWSDGNPRLPVDSMSHTAAALSETDTFWVTNQTSTQHIHLGTDLDMAQAAVEYLLTGTIPASE